MASLALSALAQPDQDPWSTSTDTPAAFQRGAAHPPRRRP